MSSTYLSVGDIISCRSHVSDGKANIQSEYSDNMTVIAHTPVSQPTLVGEEPGELGYSLFFGADLNGDGIGDLVAGQPKAELGSGTRRGQLVVFSGSNLTELYKIQGDVDGMELGRSALIIPDINSDGIPDIAGGARAYSGNLGRVGFYSGLDGSLIRNVDGVQAGGGFGWRIASIKDINSDNVDDLVVTAYLGNRVHVVSGANGTILKTHVTTGGTGQYFGMAVAVVDDLTGDNIEDLVVAAYLDDSNSLFNNGVIYFINTDTGAVIDTIDGIDSDQNLGRSLSTIEDLNGDGKKDLLIGAVTNGSSNEIPYVYLVDPTNRQVLHTFFGPSGSGFGYDVRSVGDVDGDGKADIGVGARDFNSSDGQALFIAHTTIVCSIVLMERLEGALNSVARLAHLET